MLIQSQPITFGQDFSRFKRAAAVENPSEEFRIERYELVPSPVCWHEEESDFSQQARRNDLHNLFVERVDYRIVIVKIPDGFHVQVASVESRAKPYLDCQFIIRRLRFREQFPRRLLSPF